MRNAFAPVLPALAALALALALVPITAARAARTGWDGPAEAALLRSGDPDSLRAGLQALAATAESFDAAMAYYYRGLSFERAANPDSAIASYRRSLGFDIHTPAQSAFVDAMLRRRAPGDVAEVIRLLEVKPGTEAAPGSFRLDPDPARLGWAYVLAGDVSHGLAVLQPLEARLTSDIGWRYRFARAYVASDDKRRAGPYLEGLSLLARSQDPEVASMLHALDSEMGPNAHLRDQVKAKLEHADDRERTFLRAVGGRRIRLRASDGTLIGGTVYADTASRRSARTAIVLGDVADPPADYDSLVAGLRGAGLAVLVLDPRGWGWSVAPDCALPDTWRGREDALEARVARDVHDAISAFARVATIDTSRCLVIAVGSMSPVALAAAEQDRRIGLLALLDPWISPVGRGAALARARASAVPTYIQVGLHDRPELPVLDLVVRACPMPASRLATVMVAEHGAAAFRGHPDVTRSCLRWIDETWRLKPVKRPPPPPTPRAG